MASSQPANSTITVYRRLRFQRQDQRHDSVRSVLSPGFRALEAVVPGEEVRVIRNFDTSFKSDRYFRGHQVYVYNRAPVTYATAVSTLTGIEIPFQIGRDKFLNKDAANVGDDLFGEAQVL